MRLKMPDFDLMELEEDVGGIFELAHTAFMEENYAFLEKMVQNNAQMFYAALKERNKVST
jgi:hypothetical protein